MAILPSSSLLPFIASSSCIDKNDLDHFADCLVTHKCHGASWPDGMTEDLYEQTWTENAWQFYNSFKYPSLQDNAQVGIGFLLLDIWQVYISDISSVIQPSSIVIAITFYEVSFPQPMNATVAGEPGVAKFLLISGHDITCE